MTKSLPQPRTFRAWFNVTLRSQHAKQIAAVGSRKALRGVVTNQEIAALTMRHAPELWAMALKDADSLNYSGPVAFLIAQSKTVACRRLIDLQRVVIFYACDQLALNYVNLKSGGE